VWALFAVALAAPVLREAWSWRPILYALLSLTVIRMLPVALAVIGAELQPISVLFIGWFGPRGLASVVFLVLAMDELHLSVSNIGTHTVVWAILLSVLLHGLTGGPFARAYGARITQATLPSAELNTSPEPRLRQRSIVAAPGPPAGPNPPPPSGGR
jgi:NhaP-type Na+/H+ or K+/H+ antiporter